MTTEPSPEKTSPSSLSVKQVLELLWNDALVRCPRHITWWTREKVAHHKSELATSLLQDPPLFYTKGRQVKTEPKQKPPPVGGGHSV